MSIKGLFSLIGMIVGGLLVIPFGMKVIDLLKHKNNFDSVSETYFTNIVEVPVRLIDLDQGLESYKRGNYRDVVHTVKYSASGGRDASEYISENYKIDRDFNSGQYFKIVMVVPQMDISAHEYFRTIEGQDSLVLLVNKEEYEILSNGTKDSPYLVFGVKGAEKPLSWTSVADDKLHNVDIKPEQYAYSAQMYWTYIATKEDFERRFGRQK